MAGYEHASDEELMIRFYDCDDKAFDALWNRYAPKLTRFAERILGRGSRVPPEEVVQETLLKTWSDKGRPSAHWRRPQPVEPWLFTNCLNRIRTMLKKHRREIREGDLRPPRENAECPQHLEVESDTPNPNLQYKRHMLMMDLWDCLDALDPPFWEVVVLVDFYGFGLDKLAEILDIPYGTLGRYRYEAKEMLKTCLREKRWSDKIIREVLGETQVPPGGNENG